MYVITGNFVAIGGTTTTSGATTDNKFGHHDISRVSVTAPIKIS